MSYPVNTPCLIEWQDAYSEIEPEEEIANIGMTIKTLGWVMPNQENEDYIGYAQDWNTKLGKYQGITYLPKRMIVKITRLKGVRA